MEIEILDAHSLIELPGLCGSSKATNPLYEQLTELVKAKKVTFPDQVLSACKRFAPDEVVTVWASAVSGHRAKIKMHYSHEQTVLGKCRQLLDEDDENEQSHIQVAAMALALQEQHDITVVSEDAFDHVGRISLHSASSILGFPVCNLSQFLTRHGLDGYLI